MTSHPPAPRVIPRPSERAAQRITVGRGTATQPIVVERLAAQVRGTRLDATERTFASIAVVAMVAAALLFGVLGLLGRADTTIGILVVPVFGLTAAWALRRWVEPIAGPGAVTILLAGLALRFLGAVPRLLAGVDAVDYQREGERIASHVRVLDFSVEAGRSVPGTGAVRWLSGIVNVFTVSSYVTTFLVFTTIAFVGQLLFVMAARPSLSTKQFRVLLILLMVWPAMTFWPSSIGKESVVLFGAGLATFGAAQLYARRLGGAVLLLGGLFAVGMVRPHVALIVLAAVITGMLARQEQGRSRVLAHLAMVVVVGIGTAWLSSASADLFGLEAIDGIDDVGIALDFAQNRTSQDVSQFTAVRVDSPADYPMAAATVLLRPFPWEAPNAMALLSAIESVALFICMLWAFPGLLNERRRLISNGVVLNSAAFTAIFVFLFSAIGNFGILSRQRVQVLPFVFLLLAIGIGSVRAGRNAEVPS